MTRSVVVRFPALVSPDVSDQRAFEAVVRMVTTTAPLVEVSSPGMIIFAAKGPSRYFGGEAIYVQRLHRDIGTHVASDASMCRWMQRWGVGLADSRFVACAAAEMSASRGSPCVVQPDVTQEFCDALPVAALHRFGDISDETVDLLQRLGLATCGSVRTLGEAALIDRFGAEGRRISQLTNAADPSFVAPGPVPSDFSAVFESDEPLHAPKAVLGSLRSTVRDVTKQIADHGQQCVRLLVSCETENAERRERIWGEPKGFTETAILQRVEWQLEGWLVSDDAVPDAPTSGVVRVEVVPLECRELLVVQPLLWGGVQENTERASRAVAMALAVDPSVSIAVPRWEGGRQLADAWSWVDVSLVDLRDGESAAERVEHGSGIPRRWTGSVPTPVPAAVMTEAPAVHVCDAHGRDVWVTGRHELSSPPTTVSIDGGRGVSQWCVHAVAGPWPVEERWWDPRRRRRHARLQVLVTQMKENEHGKEHRRQRRKQMVLLLGRENQQWSLLAYYG